MAHTITSATAAELYSRLEPWQTDALATFIDAVGSAFDPLRAVIADQGVDGDTGYVPGWGPLFDVDLCPAEDLGYLGQFVGVAIPTGTDDATARQLVRAEAGFARGTLGSIQSAVQRSISTPWAPLTAYLSGVLVSSGSPAAYYKATSNFTSGATFDTAHLALVDVTSQYHIRERQNSSGTVGAYLLTIVVRPEQLTPPTDQTALVAAVTTVKPAGIVLSIVQADSPIWSDATLAWSAVAGSVTWASVATGDV